MYSKPVRLFLFCLGIQLDSVNGDHRHYSITSIADSQAYCLRTGYSESPPRRECQIADCRTQAIVLGFRVVSGQGFLGAL